MLHHIAPIVALIAALCFFAWVNRKPEREPERELTTDEQVNLLLSHVVSWERNILQFLLPQAEQQKTTYRTWAYTLGEHLGALGDDSLSSLRSAVETHRNLVQGLHSLVHVTEGLPEDFDVFYKDVYADMLKRIQALYA